MASKVTTLYEDSAKTNALYPRTKVSAISDNSSNSLQQLLDAKQDDLIAGSGITVSGSNISSYTDMDLLWTNASPYSSFAAQTISLDLSNYNYVFIIFSYGYDEASFNTQRGSVVANKNDTCGITILYTNRAYSAYRWFLANNNGVQFGQPVGADGDTNAVPYKIYGIK